MNNTDILKLAKEHLQDCAFPKLTFSDETDLLDFAAAIAEPLEARVADYRERYENCMIEVATRGLELAQQEARIAELEEALAVVGTNCADVKYWKLANHALTNKSYCPKCGKSWDLHEMGVPAPYCP